MRGSILAAVLACTACKEKQATKPAEPTATPPQVSDAASAPGAPEPRERGPVKPITIDEANAALPAIDGRPILPLKQTKDGGQVHATWCIDGESADDVAKQVGQWMAKAGYTGLSIRGDARKAGVAGDRGGLRMSMVVSASSAQVCAAPAHYFASATIYKP